VKKGGIKMDNDALKKAFQKNRVFKIGSGFLFAVQIPDDSVGCSGSRCSNCSNSVAYCEQRCKHCGFPFIGPFGFPQISVWETLSPEQKRTIVEEVYVHYGNRGRLLYTNVEPVPLTSRELKKIERISEQEDEYFLSTHFISAKEIKRTLFTLPS
jgi:hypothetical protein